MCYSVAPSTTNQNATQGIYIKDIKWLGKSLQAYSIKMQYENIFKVIGVVHVILVWRNHPKLLGPGALIFIAKQL